MGTAITLEEIKKDVRDSVVEEAAVQIKRYYKAFDPNGKPPAEDSAYLEMASALINKGEFTAGENTIKRDEAIKKLRETGAKFPAAEEKISETIKNLEQVPDEETVNKIGETIHKGIEKSTGFFSGLGGFFEAILNYIMGFIDWLASGCKKPMMECIGERFAGTTTNFVKAELQNQATQDEKVGALLTAERIEQINAKVHSKTVRTFTGGEAKPKTSRLAQTVTEENPIRGIIDSAVKAEVAKQFTQDNPKTSIDETGVARKALLDAGNYYVYQHFSEADVQTFRQALEKATLEVVHDQSTAKMDQNQIREAIAKKVTDTLPWAQGTEDKIKEAFVMGADNKSVLSDEMLGGLQSASTAYNKGILANGR